MKASAENFLTFLRKSTQFIIPIYQRTYSWSEAECLQLWEDIMRTGANDQISAHFIGSIVYIEKGLFQVMGPNQLLVIDGQQRLTTITLILEALARSLVEEDPLEGFSQEQIRNYYFLNPFEQGSNRYKLLLSQTDKDSLLALVEQKPWPSEHSLKIRGNFEFFEKKIKGLGSNKTTLCKGLLKLVVVDIALNRDEDNPQLIFESMNSTGRELSQADLIRNYILMGLNTEHQNQLYKDHWRPMELAFGQEAYGEQFDSFMRHYLTLKTGEIPKLRQVYTAFKAHSQEPDIAGAGVDELVSDIHEFAGHYCEMALEKEKGTRLALAFSDLTELRVEVAYPFLLELYHDYAEGILSETDFEEIIRLVESYVFRRAVCSIPPNSLNKTFATFTREIIKDRYLESVQVHFQLLPSYRRFPSDKEFGREIQKRDLYNFRSRRYWLRRLENNDRKERVPVDEFTIEHILPQNKNLSQEWQDDLGFDWQSIQEKWLHTLGNLTLTGYNSEYSDRPFVKKRDMTGGFRESPLRVNEDLGSLEKWSEVEIKDRAENLAEKALSVWVSPSVSEEVINEIRPKEGSDEAQPGTYTIGDHPYLTEGSVMYGNKVPEIYQALRKELLALDPCVKEEFLKVYVAYKAETNFVDVVPKAKRLLLSLNMKFHELNDPRGLAKDVSSIGRWGNGDVEVGLQSSDEIPYVMGLIRQAFEIQMEYEQEA